jgi:rubrerythrin
MEVLARFKEIVGKIIADDRLHALWLNSLSMMENTGSRKISRYEDPVHTNITELKHAAEEARHAYYLKKQLSKLKGQNCVDYSFPCLIAPVESHHYLDRLDVAACRYLKDKLNLEGRALKYGAYLLVTYSIEVRADELYGVYQAALTEAGSKVNVKSIIAEEEGHLAEMHRMLTGFHPNWQQFADDMLKIEQDLFAIWIRAIGKLPEIGIEL